MTTDTVGDATQLIPSLTELTQSVSAAIASGNQAAQAAAQAASSAQYVASMENAVRGNAVSLSQISDRIYRQCSAAQCLYWQQGLQLADIAPGQQVVLDVEIGAAFTGYPAIFATPYFVDSSKYAMWISPSSPTQFQLCFRNVSSATISGAQVMVAAVGVS